ncbi:MAG: sensor histidine kinase [Chloroflexi bacterium]|nr:sensor histidine kinase [Chloroflexota bacterium]
MKWAKEAIGDRKLSVEQQIRERTRELAATKEEMRKQAHQLRQVLARSFRTAEEERRRIAVDTHDGVLQLVISSLYEVQALEAIVPEAGPLGEKLRFVQTLLTDAITEMRRVIRNLRPPVLEQAGLEQVLRSYVTSYQEISGLPCSLESNGNSFRLSSERELAIFRIVQEALHNVKKHAEASHIRISVDFSSEALRVVVADDGTGFDQKAVSADQAGHLGLISMRERAESIGARLGVESAPHRGTKVVVEVPAGEPQAAVEEAALEEKSE